MKNQEKILKEELKNLICKRIIELRKQYGLTLLEFIQKTNIKEKELIKIEKGSKLPQLCVLNDICNGLGIRLYDFFDSDKFNDLTKL